jgi:16S rRNA processing protein RimM
MSIQGRKQAGKGLMAFKLEGISHPESAESLQGMGVWVHRKEMAPLEEEEFWHQDLMGLQGQTVEGEFLGELKAVYNFGAGDVLEFVTPEKEKITVPFTKEAVPQIDIKNRKILVDWPIFKQSSHSGKKK